LPFKYRVGEGEVGRGETMTTPPPKPQHKLWCNYILSHSLPTFCLTIITFKVLIDFFYVTIELLFFFSVAPCGKMVPVGSVIEFVIRSSPGVQTYDKEFLYISFYTL
jgi:hypothetical protein